MSDAVTSVLIVEDEPAHGEAMRCSFDGREEPYKTRLVSTLQECRSQIALEAPDVLIADMKLPDGTVFDLLDSLKDMIAFPVIVITSCGNETMAVRAIKAGAMDYVVKSPQTFADMSHLVMRVVREWHAIESQRRAEQSLRNSEATMRGVFAAAPIGIVLTRDRVILAANDDFCVMLGYAMDELIGRHALFLYTDEEEYERAGQALYSDFGNGVRKHCETRWLRKDGTIMDVLVNVMPVDIAQPKSGFVLTAVDITERKRAEEVLRESEARYRRIVETAGEGIVALDERGVITFINKRLTDMLGYTVQEVMGRMASDFFPPEDRADHLRMMQERAAGISSSYERRYVHKSGKILTMQTNATPLYDEHLVFRGSFAMMTDVTEQKLAEEAQKRLVAILETTTDMVAWALPDGQVSYVNKAGRHMLGLSEQDLARFCVGDAHPPAVADFIKAITFPIAAKEGVWRGETVVRAKDGRDIPVSQVIIAHRAPDGSVTHFSTIIRDITEFKKAENVLRRDKETFEREVREKTRELMQIHEQLERAKRLSDIGALAATVAHELRSPLAAIALAVYNMRHSMGDASMERHFLNINKKVAESDQIINNLLFYTKMKPPQKTEFAVKPFFDELVSTLFAAVHDPRPMVELTIDKSIDQMLVADQIQVRELFENLLHNSIDAVECKADGFVTVSVSCQDKKMLKVVIKDNGVGIREEDMKRIHDPFFTTKAKGTGLGLAVCNEIVRLHSGSIDIVSEYGKGAVVTVLLPMRGTV